METIDIVMPVYDSPEVVKQTIESFFSSTYDFESEFRLIVFNDGSPGVGSDDWDFLRNAADVYIESATNRGIGFSMNGLMNEARSDWVIVVESDALAPPTWLNKVVSERNEVLKKFPNAKWIGFKIVDTNADMVFYYRDLNQIGETIGLPLGKDAKAPYYNVLRKVTHVSNVCSIINRKAFLEVGGTDPELKKQWIDADLGMSLNQAGHNVVVSPNISFIHNKPHSESNQDTSDYVYFRKKWSDKYAGK